MLATRDIGATLRLKFPNVEWPELPDVHLSELPELQPLTTITIGTNGVITFGDGQLPNGDQLTLPNEGVVNLKKGMARVRVGRGKQ